MTSRLFSRLLLLGSLGLSSVARAQSSDSAVAQALFDEAKALMAGGHAAAACPKLEESQRLDPRSGTLINLASCYEQTGRLASAWGRYVDAAAAARLQGNTDREEVARERAAALVPRLSKLAIVLAPPLNGLPGLELRRDGVVVGQPAWGAALPSDTGQHKISATAPGRRPFEATVTVAGEGQTTTVNVPELAALVPDTAAPTSPPQPAPEEVIEKPAENPAHELPAEPPAARGGGLSGARVAALVVGGLGVVGLGVGSGFGLASKSKHDEADKYCTGGACTDQRGVTAGDAAQTYGNISTAAMIVGGVGLAAGITIWLTAPAANGDTASARLGLGLGTLQVSGAF